MQLELSAEEFYNQFLSFEELDKKEKGDKKNKFKRKSINEKLEALQSMLKDVERYKVSTDSSGN